MKEEDTRAVQSLSRLHKTLIYRSISHGNLPLAASQIPSSRSLAYVANYATILITGLAVERAHRKPKLVYSFPIAQKTKAWATAQRVYTKDI